MIVLDVEQGTEEWLLARMAIPTASEMSNIVTPKGKRSDSHTSYMYDLLAEYMTGKPLDKFRSKWMKRGNVIEDEAREFYEYIQGATVKKAGLIYKDDRRLFGASPDGLIDNERGLEVKCPAPNTQIKRICENVVPSEYVIQIQTCMYVTGYKWWDFLSYYPGLDHVLIPVKRDEEIIKFIRSYVNAFVAEMLEKRKFLTGE